MAILKPIPEYAQDIATICADGWRQTVEGRYSQEYQAATAAYWYNVERVRQDIINGIYTHVCLLDSRVVGTIGGDMIEDGTGSIYVLYVEARHRYVGIGTQLLDALTKQQTLQGAKEQCVSVEEGNTRGIPFYEARGFGCKGRNIKRNDETGDIITTLAYWRPL